MGFILELLAAAGGSIIKLLLGRWLNRDPEKERLDAEIKEKDAEIDRLQAPARSKQEIIDSLRQHAQD
jgi:hypothetical protein